MKMMKKILAIFLALTLAFSMCACEELDNLKSVELPPLPDVSAEESAETEAAATPEVTVAPEVTAEPLSNQVIVNISGKTTQDFDPAAGTELILTFACETPSVYIEGRDVAAAAINDYIALLDETYYTGNDYGVGTSMGYSMMLELAQDNYGYVVSTGAEDVSLEYASSRSVTVARADDKVLSLVYNDYTYTGGAHGNYGDTGYVFNTETGEKISLDQLSTDFDAFTAFAVKYMVDKAESDQELSQKIDAGIVPTEQYSAAFGALLREGSWYFNNEGLAIFSDLYELSSYAAGIIEFTIPYADLKGVIDDKWLPSQRSGEGEFSIKALSDVENGTQQITDKVIVDEGGEEVCLIADGTVYDVKLSAVDYTDRFFETAQLWHCSYLSDSAIQVVTLIPEGMPKLMLSYNTGDGETHRLLISQSGIDGSLTLVDDSIEAVG